MCTPLKIALERANADYRRSYVCLRCHHHQKVCECAHPILAPGILLHIRSIAEISRLPQYRIQLEQDKTVIPPPTNDF